MATLRPASKISARPQIKAVKQPIPRQVILPKKAAPKAVKAPARPLVAPPLPMMPRPAIMPMGQPVQQLPRVPNQPQYPTNAGFDAYGFDSSLVDYLNNQKQMSYTDGGISYNYDPSTQIFTGGTRAGPVTMTLAEMQAQAQNYGSRPVFDGGLSDGPYMPRPYNVGDEVRNVPISDPYYPIPTNTYPFAGANNIAPTLAQNTANNQMYGEQLPLGGNPMFNMVGAPQFNQQQYQSQPFGQPMMQQGLGAMPNYNQQGFVPMGGYDPQNTSNGSFGAIQQPMGGFGNIGSLLGKG